MPDYLAAGGITWEEVKAKLEDTTNKNVDIRRLQLEYPTEDVTFAYLAAINKAKTVAISARSFYIHIATVDEFTDKAVEGVYVADAYTETMYLRATDWTDSYQHWARDLYMFRLDPNASTKDFLIRKYIDGSATDIASESVDLDEGVYLCKGSVAGSTLKYYRDDLTTSKLEVTDTDIASGSMASLIGLRDYFSKGDPCCAKLLAPSSPAPKPEIIIETEIIGSGIREDPFRPHIKQELVEISKLDKMPVCLKRTAKRYEILKKKGFTDEEIEAILGRKPKTHVDLASVTWGAFDHKPEHNTMLICITGGNQYTGDKAILEQIEHAKRKNLKVVKPPKDYHETCRIYNELRKEFSEWIAGKDNFAYMTLGHEDFEAMQVADTYHGNIVDGIKPDAYKNVPEFEMRRTLNMWKERLKRAKVMKSEAKKHIEKIEKVERVGW